MLRGDPITRVVVDGHPFRGRVAAATVPLAEKVPLPIEGDDPCPAVDREAEAAVEVVPDLRPGDADGSCLDMFPCDANRVRPRQPTVGGLRSEEHTSELQSRGHLVCRLLL